MSIPATIDEQIDNIENMEISYRTLHKSTTLMDEESKNIIEIPYRSLIDKYSDFFNELILVVELPDHLQQIYRYNPKRVSYDLYGTTEFWYEILVLNNCASIIDFKPVDLVVYSTDGLKNMINEMMILEEID